MKKRIEEKMKILLNQPFLRMGRAGNLLWMCFGQNITVKNKRGDEEIKSTYALNIQCAWRLVKDGKILVASGDYYLPKAGINNENFEWDKFGANRFDEKVEGLKKLTDWEMIITEVGADEIGGLYISFDSGIKLEVFPNDSLEDEFWRFIEFNGQDSEHFVVFDRD